jgi:hypothetical protein
MPNERTLSHANHDFKSQNFFLHRATRNVQVSILFGQLLQNSTWKEQTLGRSFVVVGGGAVSLTFWFLIDQALAYNDTFINN